MISSSTLRRVAFVVVTGSIAALALTGCPDNNAAKPGASPAASGSSATPTTTAKPATSAASSGSGW
jgi:hypothetical protein